MTFDSRWKFPQGKNPDQFYTWAEALIKELRKGDYLGGAIPGTGIPNSQLADMAAWTIKMRNAGTDGDPQDQTINALTEETSIDPAADFFPFWDAGSSVMRKGKPNNFGLRPTLIASGAITNAAQVDIPVDGQAWDEVEFNLINLVPQTDNTSLNMLVSQSGSFLTGASDYQWALTRAGTAVADQADTEITIADGVGNATNERLTAKIHLHRPTAASFTKTAHWHGGYRGQSGTALDLQGWGELILNSNAIEDVRFIMSSGQIASGFYYALGHKYS